MNENLGDDIIRGMAAIAQFLGMPERKAFYLASHGSLPGVFKEGNSWVALKSEIVAAYRSKARGGKATG
jgi:hypothetical protein